MKIWKRQRKRKEKENKWNPREDEQLDIFRRLEVKGRPDEDEERTAMWNTAGSLAERSDETEGWRQDEDEEEFKVMKKRDSLIKREFLFHWEERNQSKQEDMFESMSWLENEEEDGRRN